MKKIILSLSAVALMFSACQEEDKVKELSQEEARVAISETTSDIESDVIDMVESEGAMALLDMTDFFYSQNILQFSAGEGEINAKEYLQNARSIGQKFSVNSRLKETDPTFEEAKGVYEWDVELQDFKLTSTDVDYVEFRFPSEGSQTNNASLFIYNLVESGDVVLELEAELKLDGELMASLNLNAAYAAGAEDPNKITLDLFVKPFHYSLDVDDSQAKSSSIAFEITRGDESIAHFNVGVDFKSEMKEFPNFIEGSVGYGKMKVKGSIDVAGMEAAADDNVNDYIDMKLYHDGDFVGDLEIVFTTDGDLDVFVVYADDSSESLVDLLQPTLDEIEAIILELEGV
ncbi:hypothetical protein [Reichenbachiella ulvae]|uniref:Uncharacterized protein n=1 Tax=Reichenbachiella ulvae TaxID=2980104 RepID=A0ABT3CR85_9BACT|nr:hypothetical protein [Reichenbachiella ulvae]MCV9386137.1 hypothetical protein [Reichenbachiella ulvae]